MTTAPAPRAARPGLAAVARHLDAVAAALSGLGIASRVTRPAGTPALTTGTPAGPDGASVAIDPDLHAGPGLRLDCTCIWTPAPGTTPETAATAIAAVLNATRVGADPPVRPPAAGAARLAEFLRRHPGWSAFWDRRYGLWRAAEDDPDSARYAETPDADAVISYITACS